MTRAAATEIAEEQIAYWRARDYTVQRAWDALGVQRTAMGWSAVTRFLARWQMARADDVRERRAG